MSKRSKKNLAKDLAKELDVFDEMLSALVELLEQKGIVTQKEWESKIRERILKRGRKKSYRELQFAE